MANVTMMGLGAMGTRMAQRLLAGGHRVTVWNRTPARAQALLESGAQWADTPRLAVQQADVALALVRDDEASRSVWLDPQRGAAAGLRAGAIAIESSTVTTPWARELGDALDAAGHAVLDAPVAGSRPQAEAGKLIVLAGGRPETLERARPVLEAYAGAIHHCGPAVGAGTTVKLMVNDLFATQLALIAELVEFARAQGLDPARAIEVLGATPVCSPAAKLSAMAMLGDAFPAAFPIELVDKDLGYVIDSAQTARAQVPLSEAVRSRYAAAIEAGLGADNITGIVQLLRAPNGRPQSRDR